MLLLANAVFYFVAGIEGFIFIGATIISTYLISLKIDKVNSDEKQQIKENKGVWSREEKKYIRKG